MGSCTKLGYAMREGVSVDTLFCHGQLSVDSYYRYLREYDKLTRRGIKPKVAVGVLRNGIMDYKWTDKIEIEPNGDTYMYGACPNFGCPTEHELSEMFRSEESRLIERQRRSKCVGVKVGCVPFRDWDECIDGLSRILEDCDG